jgi:hypothetical protein
VAKRGQRVLAQDQVKLQQQGQEQEQGREPIQVWEQTLANLLA